MVNNLKNQLKLILGNFLILIFPKRTEQLAKGGSTAAITTNSSVVERLICLAYLKKLEKREDFETLSNFHKNFWIEKGDNYFKNIGSNVLVDFFKPYCSYVLEDLKSFLAKHPVGFKTLVEIGTGNGDVLNYLSSELPMVNRFIGIDLSAAQTLSNRKRYEANGRLEFLAADGFKWIKENNTDEMIFLTSRGVLEYFTEDQLKQMLSELGQSKNVVFLAIEPIGKEVDFEKNTGTVTYGIERSFSHNYQKNFTDAGFQIWHESKPPFEDRDFYMIAIGAVS